MIRQPKSAQEATSKLTEDHKALRKACFDAIGEEAYEIARKEFNTRILSDIGAEAESICQVSYNNLPKYLRK